MRTTLAIAAFLLLAAAVLVQSGDPPAPRIDPAQTPDWKEEDVQFLLHGSMSAEFLPDRILHAFVKAWPDLFPNGDLSACGVIGRGLDEPPIGFTLRKVDHMGGVQCWGINCMSCHSGLVENAPNGPQLVLGLTGTFDVTGFYGAIVVSMLRAGSKEGIGPYLTEYLGMYPSAEQMTRAVKEIEADPFATKGVEPGALHPIDASNLDADRLRLLPDGPARLARESLKVFHNIRTALHIPDQPPKPTTAPPGPGRNDAFGLLAAALLGRAPAAWAPVKYAPPWNLSQRHWLHWDANTADPDLRNVLAALGLGCPLTGQGKMLDMKLVHRQTALTETLRPPKFPFPIDAETARRGEKHYQARCAACHEAPEEKRLYAVSEVGTDGERLKNMDAAVGDAFGKFVASLSIDGWSYKEGTLRVTQKYVAEPMEGVWARAPYLHNGTVRTMADLLTPSAKRPKTWRRGSRVYDPAAMGFTDEGAYVLDTSRPGESCAGHEYGADLSAAEKKELIEYLKTR